ncbi:UTP--glucose-1-phosphate uridylyltransferase [Anaerosphaera aminiphila DSM 21120]|uniref:UTP--glucose-1-phosphate uridylyltransferase n=1 Tax=Anaerosphaera aminiphila DSM 21120 TaxID=1120995 RepID=A0A1M5SXN3_9FIRM|nr:UTP--glucose-1-phosphate uridylyltransferase GalU [Anaerosphaera aminiphila]SHH43284.1 UTP--glucose-1-phosphate uridylyltransferase [Anaerosphaera aminiphila DSM 21120]
MKVKKAIIPAAGLGTRFLPFTKSCPKEMLPIVDTPTIDYIVREIVESGIEDILIILGRNKNSIEDYFDKNIELEYKLTSDKKNSELKKLQEIENLANIHFIRQKEPLGLGHAVYCAKDFVGNEPFALLLGDEIIKNDINATSQLINLFEKHNSTIIGLSEVERKDVDKYGIVEINKLGQILSLVEKPDVNSAPSNLAIIGRYIISPKIFDILPTIAPGKNNEIQLTDAFIELLKEENIYGLSVKGERYDIGSKEGYLKATIDFALEREDLKEKLIKHMERGI